MRWTTIGREILANALMSLPVIRQVRIRAGRTIGYADVESSRSQWVDLEGELGDLTGKRVVELGPGDVIPMAWGALKCAASSNVAIDRFGGSIANPRAQALQHIETESCTRRWIANTDVLVVATRPGA